MAAAFIFVLSIVFLPLLADAQVAANVANLTEDTGLRQVDVRVVIIRIVQFVLGFLGLLAVLIVMYGGWMWMTAAGKEERITIAKKILTNGFIGLSIILLSFAIVSFILNKLQEATSTTPTPGPGPGPCTNCSALGGGIIEDHYPGRNATGIPRNTKIFITFKEPIKVVADGQPNEDEQSFIKDATQDAATGNWSGKVNINIFKLTLKDDSTDILDENEMNVYTNAQKKIFVLDPTPLLGSPDNETVYQATIKGRSGTVGLTKSDDTAGMLGDYDWNFQVSTIIDTTPPKIIDIVPFENVTEARNTAVQITFNEAVDPLGASGPTTGDTDNITIKNGATLVEGTYEIGNGYRTVEFLTNDQCGVNACGEPIYCLPANADLTVVAKAATLWTAPAPACGAPGGGDNPSEACPPPPYDGITDVAGNSLDGNRQDPPTPLKLPTGNGTAEGPGILPDDPKDTFVWSFKTNSSIIKTGPKILEIKPNHDDNDVSLSAPVEAIFNRRLRLVRSNAVRIYASNITNDSFSPYWTTIETNTEICSEGQDCPNHSTVECPIAADPEDINSCGRSTLQIQHGDFVYDVNYEPRIGYLVKDIYGNCFSPSEGPEALPHPPYGQIDDKAIDDPPNFE